MANVPTYTRGEWAQALAVAICKPKPAPDGAVSFFVGWTVAEYSQAESKTASYNCLNMENGSDISAWNPKSINSNGIVAFSSFADGVNATANRLLNGELYGPIVIAAQNNNLSPRSVSSNTAVQKALGAWVNGPNGGPISQSYLNNIIAGSGSTNEQLTGVAGDTTITIQDANGNALPDPNDNNNAQPAFSVTQIVKVLGGALMILAGVALLIKSLSPNVLTLATGGKK